MIDLDQAPSIRHHRITVDQLIEAVVRRDHERVAAVINPLDRSDLEAVAIILADYADPTEARIEATVRLAAAAFQLSVIELTSRRRDQAVLDARATAAYAMRLFEYPYTLIAKNIGLSDHTTAMNTVTRASTNPRLRGIGKGIATELGWVRRAA